MAGSGISGAEAVTVAVAVGGVVAGTQAQGMAVARAVGELAETRAQGQGQL